jgi:hypothetical protein
MRSLNALPCLRCSCCRRSTPCLDASGWRQWSSSISRGGPQNDGASWNSPGNDTVELCRLRVSGGCPWRPAFKRSPVEFRAHFLAARRNQEGAHPAMRRVWACRALFRDLLGPFQVGKFAFRALFNPGLKKRSVLKRAACIRFMALAEGGIAF